MKNGRLDKWSPITGNLRKEKVPSFLTRTGRLSRWSPFTGGRLLQVVVKEVSDTEVLDHDAEIGNVRVFL